MLDPASLLNPAWGAPSGPGRDSISDVYGTGVGPNLGGDHQEPSYDDYGDGNYGDSPRQISSLNHTMQQYEYRLTKLIRYC